MASVAGVSDLSSSLHSAASVAVKIATPQSAPVEKTEPVEAIKKVEVADKKPAEIDPKTLDQAVEKADQYFSQQKPALSFKTHQDTGRTIIQVTDRETGELIRQIPSEEMIELAEKLKDMQHGDSEKGLVFNDLG